MADDRLKTRVLRRADEDTELTEQARLVVLAALGADDDLTEVLGDEATSPELIESLTTVDDSTAEPVGAYLRSITVQGFRGIGPKVTVPMPPGPGLIVIAGRNGSGKSTLAEGLELALTGTNSRWKDKGPLWSKNWRNLHAGEPAEIRVSITEEGSGTTTIGVDWPPGGEVDVNQCKAWVQRDGQKREDTGVLGWDAALEMYRPLLSYDELGHILEGRPSDFYDQLYKLLGLEQLTDAIARLDDEVKRLKQPATELRKARESLKPVLEDHDDPRAATALAQVKKTKPNLDAIRPLITQTAASTVPPACQQAARLTAPTSDEVDDKCTALRQAAQSEHDEMQRSDALAADRSKLLEHGLTFHEQHGTQQCPVCGRGTLDDNWAVAARAALEQEQSAAQALTAARAATQQARSALVAVVRAVAPPPLAEAGLTTVVAAREAYEKFSKLPTDTDHALADHAAATLAPLQAAYKALRQEAPPT